MSAHTPGPWSAVMYEDRPRISTSGGPSPQTEIAELHTSLPHGGSAEANARLISAAPDLLASLVALEAELAEIGERENEPDSEALTAARVAIAKAMGAQP